MKPRRIKEALDGHPELRAEIAQAPDWPGASTLKAKRVVARLAAGQRPRWW